MTRALLGRAIAGAEITELDGQLAKATGAQVLLVGQRSGIVYALDPTRNGELFWQTNASEGRFAGAIDWAISGIPASEATKPEIRTTLSARNIGFDLAIRAPD